MENVLNESDYPVRNNKCKDGQIYQILNNYLNLNNKHNIIQQKNYIFVNNIKNTIILNMNV